MKITKIEIYKLNVPLKEPFIISLGVIKTANSIVLKIHTDHKIYGTGEGNPYMFIVGETQEADFEYAKMLAKLLLGKNPLEIENRLAEIERILKFNPTVKSAFDMALYDILGKYTGLPLYKLWGGTNNREIITDMTVSIDAPEKMQKDALKFKNAGFPAIKVKLGDNKKNDTARIAAIREAIGYDIPLRIDANQGWDTNTAIGTLKALDKYDIEHCEEPIPRWNISDLPYVREHSPIAIMADESLFDHHDAFRLAKMQACDYFNIKLSKSGGLNTALKIVSIAEAAGIKSQVGCMSETRFGLTALMHLVIARKNIIHFDLDSALMLADDPVRGGIEYKENGRVELNNDLPGIGADFNPEYLEKMEKVIIS
ncbi:MAG: dipeptide epimerase [Bacteroidales bacterium]|nr:dipeptide epimerase [Bacteroidales bacterium]